MDLDTDEGQGRTAAGAQGTYHAIGGIPMHIFEIFPWNEHFETGISSVDDQHRVLVRLLNRLAGYHVHQADVGSLSAIFDELASYAAYHFESEEAIWAEHLGADAWESGHRESHAQFVAELLRLKSEERHKPIDQVVGSVTGFLTRWLVSHILESDMRMAKAVLAIRSGMSVPDAKARAESEMRSISGVLIETILSMYDCLASRTMDLTKEVIERKRAEQELRLASAVVHNTVDAICITDDAGRIIRANPAFLETNEYSLEQLIGQGLEQLKFGQTEAQPFAEAARLGHWSGEITSSSRKGKRCAEWLTLSAIRAEQGDIENYVAVFSDITPLANLHHKLNRIAHYDVLTDLPNRVLLVDRLQAAIAAAKRSGRFLAVGYLDLDGFKEVNDRLGHAAGDLLLREIARRLQQMVRGVDTVARLGGDEFALLVGDLKSPADCRELLDRILHAVERPAEIQGSAASVSASIGVAAFPRDSTDPDELLVLADQAMYRAKRAGKSRIVFHEAAD